MRKGFSNLGGCLLAISIAITPLHAAAQPVIVHEWGTFTCLQDNLGRPIGGINVDDEPVPPFVFTVAATTVINPLGSYDRIKDLGLPPHSTDKGWLSGDPSVTMRLETPVLYIYPPKGPKAPAIPPLEVHVDFHGGVLSQFYPFATTSGLPMNGTMPYFASAITGTTSTGLTWKDVQTGASGKLVETGDKTFKDAPDWMKGAVVKTDDKVWTTPRETSAPLLQTGGTMTDGQGTHPIVQTEHFLFYRGVGHLDSPLSLSDNTAVAPGQVCIWTRDMRPLFHAIDKAWMVDIRPDDTVAFQTMDNLQATMMEGNGDLYEEVAGAHPVPIRSKFAASDFSPHNLTKLKASMQDALVKAGLYPDEASAMLRTWELSYFKNPGLRFFYIVPRPWVDKVLPLTITGAPTEITRVMVGRIELISEHQQELLTKLAAGPCPDIATLKKAAQETLAKLPKDQAETFYRGDKPLRDLGIPIPPLVKDYLDLGRFRDPLIVHEQQTHPSPALAQFIKDNHLVPNAPMTN